MDDFPAKFAGLLEATATRVRSLTVDRVEKVIRVAGLGVIAAALAVLCVLFLFLTIYTSLEIPLGEWGARAVVAGLFAAGGLFMWAKRKDRKETP